MKTEAMRMERVTYLEQGMALLDNFNFQVFTGEVMGLVPLDSLGLEVFLNLLQVNRPIFYGFVYMKEILVNTCLEELYTENNVQIISNESNLVKYMSAAENVFALRRGYKGIIIKNKIFRQQLTMMLAELELEFPVDVPLQEMSLFEKYVLEILKAVISKPDVIVLKDPSSALNPGDLDNLQRIIRYYAGKGQTFIYISVHREELSAVCDRISLMSQGRIVKVVEQSCFTEELLLHYYGPSKLLQVRNGNMEEWNPSERVFWCENLHYKNIHGLSFTVKKGECLALHDYGNQICENLMDVITFAKPEMGKVYWRGRQKNLAYKRRVAIILEDPVHSMLYENMSYEDNLCLTIDHKLQGIWRKRKIRRNIAKEIVGEKLPAGGTLVKDLTMRQKYYLIYTRILLQRPDVIFCVHPYLNVDMELQGYIGTLLKRFLEQGIAVVIISVNFQDGLQLADRLLLVRDGVSHGRLSREEFEYLIK